MCPVLGKHFNILTGWASHVQSGEVACVPRACLEADDSQSEVIEIPSKGARGVALMLLKRMV